MALVFDGAEIAQYKDGTWQGRFVHPEFGQLLEKAASEPLPGVVVLMMRFDLPTLVHRRHARLISLSALDAEKPANCCPVSEFAVMKRWMPCPRPAVIMRRP